MVCVDHVTRLSVQVGDPFGELARVWYRRRQEHIVHVVVQQNNCFFPDDAAFLVAHVVDFVEDDPGDLARYLRAATRGRRVDGHVAGHQTNVLELFEKLAILLVAEGLDRRGVDDALLVFERHGDHVLGHHCLAGRGVRRHKHGLAVFEAENGLFLKRVQSELVLFGRAGVGLVFERLIVHVAGKGHFVTALLQAAQFVDCDAR
ncbi:hypothetical protein BpHYR1_004542 [Brachionus plicatilis]|uniref:Uncharacterized protein n=1 Tax=Brachionus plicatilis TaxID=10195 RepID=A0A3M7PXM7_BRAPC|nr:hypothetical protein BpHYR1_004542 [Brachionus plicatilis]